MIRKENRYDEYAYRVATLPLDDSVDSVEEGQWITIGEKGTIIVAGADTKKAFLCTGSKRTGRDKVSGRISKNISFLLGHFMMSVSNFDAAGTYKALTPLILKDGGILTPAQADGETNPIVAYAVAAPKDGYLRIIHE